MSEHPFSTPSYSTFAPATLGDWKKRIEKELKGALYDEKMRYTLPGGLQAEAANSRENLQLTPPAMPSAAPGWQLLQTFTLTGDTRTLNQLILNQLTNGAEAICLKLPYTLAFMAEQDQDYLSILSQVLQGVHPDYIHIHFQAGMQSLWVMRAYVQWLQQQGHNPAQMQGTFVWAPYMKALWSGYWSPTDVAAMQAFDQELQQALPRYSTIASNAYMYNACGANGVQELAYGLCTLLDLARPDMDRTIHIRMASSRNVLTEIAKHRAIPLLWQRLVARYKPEWQDTTLRIHSATALWHMAVVDPHNNLIRTTLQAIAAVLGGAHYVDVQPFNQLTESNDAFGLRMAKNIQLLLKEESYLDQVADPTAGSYAIENLTTATLQAAEALAHEVMAKGGMAVLIQNGEVQAAVNEAKERLLQRYQAGKDVLVGVNKYRTTESDALPKPAFRPAAGEQNIPNIAPLRLA